MVDALFADPRLARLYDPLDPDRSDLDLYLGLAAEIEATSVLDVGCGTGTLACLLAERGIDVVAVDPAAASLDVARAKPHAHRLRSARPEPGGMAIVDPGRLALAHRCR